MLLCLVVNIAYGESGSKLSPYTNAFLEMHKQGVIKADGTLKIPMADDVSVKTEALGLVQKNPITKIMYIDGVQMVEGFVVLADGADMTDVEFAGATVVNKAGNVIVVRMPIDAIEQISELESVERVEITQPVKLYNDVAREVTNVDAVHSGTGLTSSFTGKGVIVGIVDSGIDFNHIAFKDEDGNTRIVRAFVYDEAGGRTYEDIETITTDKSEESHGTHTSGIAAGSIVGNGLQGMAPDADLYLCGLGNHIFDSEILNQVSSIVDYAKQQGKPVVVNLSLGHNTGPHDGTAAVSQGINNIAGEGAIVVVAAGNEGKKDLYVHKKFENASSKDVQCQTIIDGSPFYGMIIESYYPANYYTTINCYTGQSAQMQFVVVDTQNANAVVCESELIDIDVNNYVSIGDLSFSDDLSKYFQLGQMEGTTQNYVSSALNGSNNKYETVLKLYMIPGTENNSQRYLLALRFYGTQGDELHMWSDAYSIFIDNGDNAFTAGSPAGSYNDLATGKNLISVGAYSTKLTWNSIVDASGNTRMSKYDNEMAQVGTMADFSSYGVDPNGIWHPIIVAPGHGVESAFNRYNFDEFTYLMRRITNEVEKDGELYRYYINEGTSMACPVVTGIIATWLEYDPTLSPDDIKKIFEETAQKPEAYGTGIAEQWGPNGVIDAYAGLVYLGQLGVNDITNEQDMVIVGPNPTDGQFNVFAQGEDEVSLYIYNTGGTQVFAKNYVTDNGNIEVDLQGTLSAGVYILQVRGNECNYSGKLVVK